MTLMSYYIFKQYYSML